MYRGAKGLPSSHLKIYGLSFGVFPAQQPAVFGFPGFHLKKDLLHFGEQREHPAAGRVLGLVLGNCLLDMNHGVVGSFAF